jgi:putative spermidine/putrescine transport system permease protein
LKKLSIITIRIGLYAVLIAPLVLFGLYAFSARWFYPQPIPSEWSTAGFERLLGNTRTYQSLIASLSIAAMVSLISVSFAIPAGRTLGLRTFKGRQAAWLLLFLPTVVPPLAIGMGLNILFLQLGIAGTMTGVILAHLVPTLPYTVFTLSGAFARYDENYEHQAISLGANHIQVFFSLTLRLISPSLVVAALFAFLISWSQYLLSLLIGGGQVITLPMLLFSTVSGNNPVSIAAISLLFVTPPVLVIAFTARKLTQQEVELREQY